MTKIICAGVVTISALMLVLWWGFNPDILIKASLFRSIYQFIGLIMLALLLLPDA